MTLDELYEQLGALQLKRFNQQYYQASAAAYAQMARLNDDIRDVDLQIQELRRGWTK